MNQLKKETIIYLIGTVFTTLVDAIVFTIYYQFSGKMIATSIAWIVAVIFSYIFNSNAVFHEKMTFSKYGEYMGARAVTYVLSLGLIFFMPGWINPTIYKLFCSVVLMAINYVSSKKIIQKESKGGKILNEE